MSRTEQLKQIISTICQHRLKSSIDALENLLLSNPNQADMEKLVGIKNDYLLMADYWQRGYDDPQRLEVYDQLLHRLYVLTTNIYIHEQLRSSAYMMGVYQRPRQTRRDWSVASVKNQLEAYVTDTAILGLEPKHTRQEKLLTLNQQHQQMVQDLFEYILTSRLWSESLSEAFMDILLSPTIDINDQLLIASAITLSALNAFDITKFKVLTSVYRQSSDIKLRQRALVGWVFVMDAQKSKFYPEMVQIVSQICQDKQCCNELIELQMQLFYCMDTENDRRKIDEEIMPGLIDASRIKVTQHGLVEMDEDTLEDILHPEDAERNMEKMEMGMKKMFDMQKQGSDIYFGGFSQMKRYPFFTVISNWFVPFTPNHPLISHIWNQSRGRKFLHSFIKMDNLCDSDKYSFVLAFEQMRDQLPENLIKMIYEGEASFMLIGSGENAEQQLTPALVRRIYLQNIYRFYRLFSMRREFLNPFEESDKYLFFANGLFRNTPMEDRLIEIASFLIKRKRYDDAQKVLNDVPQRCQDYQYYMMKGNILRHLPYSTLFSELECFRAALEQKPGDQKAMMGLARVSFRAGNYKDAADMYVQLLEKEPDNRNFILNIAICLSNLDRNKDAEKILFKQNYLYPDDNHVSRALAWVLTLQDKLKQAQKLYEQLLAIDNPVPTDFLDYGYCLWFDGDITNAVVAFQQFLKLQKDESFSMETEFLNTEYGLLRQHQIHDVEIQLMLDAIAN